jgi:O-antigen/teichoic acid export membrane protein
LALFGLVSGLAISGNRDITHLIIANLISQVIVLCITISRLRALLGPKDSDEPPVKFFRKTLGYGWKAHLSNILAFVNYKADILLTNFFLGPAAVGIYVIAVALAEKLWIVSQAVSTVILPRLSQLSSEEDKRKRITPMVTRWVLAVTFVCALLLSVIAGPFIALVFGKDYIEALLPLWILLPGIVMTSASRVMANDIAARGRPEFNMYISVVVVVVNLVGNCILIPSYGLAGAAAATTFAYALNLLLRLQLYVRFSENRWTESLFVKPSDFRLLLTAVQRS